MELALFAVSFPELSAAKQGRDVLKQLNSEGKVNVIASALATKDDRGELSIEQSETPGAAATALGAVLGLLAGLAAGPAAAIVGAAAGAASGGWFDVNRASERTQFADSVAGRVRDGASVLLVQAEEPGPSS